MGMACFSNSQLLDYLDSALAPSVVRDLERHLEACLGCAARLGQYRAIRAAVETLPREEAPGHIPVGLLSRRARGALDAAERERVRRHIGECPRCHLDALAPP